MAKPKLNSDQIAEIVSAYNEGFGETPASLSVKYGVSALTVRRALNATVGIRRRESHRVRIQDKDRLALRKVLLGLKLSNIDVVIQELDKHFELKARVEEDDFFICYVDDEPPKESIKRRGKDV